MMKSLSVFLPVYVLWPDELRNILLLNIIAQLSVELPYCSFFVIKKDWEGVTLFPPSLPHHDTFTQSPARQAKKSSEKSEAKQCILKFTHSPHMYMSLENC